jgi:hypothetical protein
MFIVKLTRAFVFLGLCLAGKALQLNRGNAVNMNFSSVYILNI